MQSDPNICCEKEDLLRFAGLVGLQDVHYAMNYPPADQEGRLTAEIE
jgi:hypothetical protein